MNDEILKQEEFLESLNTALERNDPYEIRKAAREGVINSHAALLRERESIASIIYGKNGSMLAIAKLWEIIPAPPEPNKTQS